MGKNAYAHSLEARRTALLQIGEQIARQYDIDTAVIVLHDNFGFGYDRCMRFLILWEKVRNEYRPALEGGVEADVAQAHLDVKMLEITKSTERVIPFQERYPELKMQTYKGRK